jgi:hypothetical protein
MPEFTSNGSIRAFARNPAAPLHYAGTMAAFAEECFAFLAE